MTAEEDALGRVIALLDDLGIPYMVTGSIAASYYGRPRATHDAYVVIDPESAQLPALLTRLESSGFYVPAEAAHDALARRGQFNVIETTRAVKIDLIVKKDRPYSIEEFNRRLRVDFPFAPAVAAVTPEDSILSKLEWARRAGDSERQTRDAAGIVEITRGLDREYLRKWSEELGVADLWAAIESAGDR